MAAVEVSDAIAHDDHDDEVVTGEAVALDLRPTSFVLAAAGAMIDWLVYFVLGLVLLVFALTPVLSGPLGQDQASVSAILLAGIVLVLVVVPMTVEVLSRGKSLGRLAVGARIVRDDGGSIGFRHALIRSLVAVLEFYLTFGGFAAIFGLLNGKSKRLGDLLAGTYSQYERVSGEVPPVFGVPVELMEWSTTADVARIPDRLARRISQFIRQASRLTPSTRDRLSRQLATEASAYVSPIPPVNAELFIAAVITIRRDREFAAHELESARLSVLNGALSGLPHGFPRR
ncbi:MAG: hypothetical protein QOF79_1791 [Actinomycetota bacterium]|jgi:uncharacterized RDD family membrane protein YckC|nr:hypothetical protein [Actinomycetota bacterium]